MIINDIPFMTDLSDILYELKSQLHINQVDLLGTIKDTTDNIMISCPYHKGGQERKPSMGIHKRDGICHCFTCNTTATLQQMITYCFGVNDDIVGAFGWNWLLKNFLTIGVDDRKEIEIDVRRNNSSYNTIHINDYISESELDSYRYIHPYHYKRGLTDDIIEIFDLGYDSKSKCITFPIRDISGNTLFIARRSVNTKYFNYPSRSTKPLYGLYEIKKICRDKKLDFPNEIIVCESMLDSLKCWVFGKYAIALNGLGSSQQLSELDSLPCRKLILATDMDSAGLDARDRIKKYLKHKLVSEYRWDLKIAKDINDMTQEYFESLEEVY